MNVIITSIRCPPLLYYLNLGVGANFDPDHASSSGKGTTVLAGESSLEPIINEPTALNSIDISLTTGYLF